MVNMLRYLHPFSEVPVRVQVYIRTSTWQAFGGYRLLWIHSTTCSDRFRSQDRDLYSSCGYHWGYLNVTRLAVKKNFIA